MSNYQLLRARDRTAQPWKNGGGVMWDVAIFPARATTETFAWRLSIAEISASRPFSVFPGVTRHFALLAGDGVTLSIAGRPPVHMTQNDPAVEFSGDIETTATLHGGSVLALNLMVRTGYIGALTHYDPATTAPAQCSAPVELILLAGAAGLTLKDRTTLSVYDALRYQSTSAPGLGHSLDGHWLATIRQA